jgi:RHS repeat-associated protein
MVHQVRRSQSKMKGLARALVQVVAAFLPTRVFFLLFLALSMASGVRSQDYSLQTGRPTFTTAQPVQMGFVNVANGNLHLAIPLGSFPQRGNRGFAAALVYDSRIWQVVNNGTSNTWQPTNVPNSWGGWRFVTSADPGTTSALTGTATCIYNHARIPYATDYNNFTWTASDGTQRLFPIHIRLLLTTVCGGTNVSSGDAFATDSSGFHMWVNYANATVFAPDGTQVYPSVKDTNGNYFSTDSNGNVIDTLGRTPIRKTTNGNQITYAVLNSQGGTSNVVVTTETISVSTNFGQSGVTEYAGSITVIQSIQLPDGTSYSFTYDNGTGAGNFGLVKTMTLPTGGQDSYTYFTFPDATGNRNRWLSTCSFGGGTWSYGPSVLGSCPSGFSTCQQVATAKPNGDVITYTFGLNNGAWQSQAQYKSKSGSQLVLAKTITSQWNTSNPCTTLNCTGNQFIQNVTETTTYPTPSGSVTSSRQYTYDSINDGNVTKIQEWNFSSGSQPNRITSITYLTGYPHNIINRPSSITVSDGAGNPVAQTNITYDSYALTGITGVAQHDDGNYGTAYTSRGNPTQIQKCTVMPSCSSPLQTKLTYDTTGQVRSVQDSALNTTSFSYTDNFFNDAYGGPPAYTPPKPTNAYLTSVTSPLIGSATLGYYFGTGKHAYSQDQNSARTWTHFLDPSSMDRITHVYAPDGGRKLWRYNGATQIDTFLSIQNANGTFDCTSCRFDRLALDTWGRVSTNTLENDPEGYESVVTYYDSNSRVQQVSNPYRSPSDPTYGLDTYTYDGLDRVTQVTHQDGNSAHIYYGAAVTGAGGATSQQCYLPTYGAGYPTLYVDEAGKKRQTWTDGFGRIVEVQEPNTSGTLNDNTCYQYDVQNNLIQTHSGLNRSYTYDSLSRPTSATTPEAGGRTTYFYYTTASGALCSSNPAAVCRRTDARSITTTYTYDALNRLTSKTYSDGTPTVKFFYDQANPWGVSITNYLGRLTETVAYASDGSYLASAMFSYDAMGRVVLNQQCTLCSGPNPSFLMRYAYNLDGSLASLTYPSGRVVSYNVGNAQRALSATDANGTQYAVAASYTPFGAASSVIYGKVSGGFAGITESRGYDNRLQLGGIVASSSAGAALNIGASYNLPGGNNGSISSIANSSDTGRTQTFTYDTLNRVASATSQATSGADCWGQGFTDDAQANLYTIGSTQCSSGTLSVSINAYNQITGTNFGYDLAGNMTGDGTGYTYTFDAENRLTKANGMSGGPWNYTYDANARRVEKTNGSTGTLYWRSIFGGTLAESDLTASKTNGNYHEYVYFTGRKIARVDGSGSVFFYYADHVGTTRTIADSSGNMCYDADFTPYGQEMVHTNNCPQNYKFTGYERDPETGLDYAFARYYSSRLGRFMSPDPLGGDITDPQSLNRYAYVGNNPTSFSDPSGMFRTPWGFGGTDFGLGWNWNEFDLLGMDLNSWSPVSTSEGLMWQQTLLGSGFDLLGLLGGDIDWSRLGAVANPPPPCDRLNREQPNLVKFAGTNFVFAQIIAGSLGTTAANILGLSSYESDNGTSRLSTQYNNYFSLGVGSFFPGSVGTYETSDHRKFGVYLAPGFLNSGLSFAAGFQGQRVSGLTSPSDFAAALTTPPLAFNSEQGYAGTLTNRIWTMQIALDCMKKGK